MQLEWRNRFRGLTSIHPGVENGGSRCRRPEVRQAPAENLLPLMEGDRLNEQPAGIVIDATGQSCPVPLIMTRQALDGLAAGQTLVIRIDNETSMQNVRRYLEDHGIPPVLENIAGVYTLRVTGGVRPAGPVAEAASYCQAPQTAGDYVVFIRHERLGSGSDELGRLLLKAFVGTLKEMNPLPRAVIFMNGGIMLALKSSPSLTALQELANRGVSIMTCGTCLDYYQKKPELGVGVISNMFDILSVLSHAGLVITP